MSHCYKIYGLQLESTVPLNGLYTGSTDTACDISIDWHENESTLLNGSVQWRPKRNLGAKESELVSFWETSTVDGPLLKLSYVIDETNVDFILDQGWRRISVIKPDYIKPGRLRSYLLGSVLSSILRARGTICLHASV